MKAANPKKKSTVGLKLISVILAVLLWIYIGNQGGNTPRQNTVQADLQYVHLGDGLSVKQAPQKVSVTMWGNYGGSSNVMAYVDLGGLSAGTHLVPVNLEPVPGAMFTRVNPKEVEVVLTRPQQREFRVEYQINGEPPAGYELLDTVITPDKCIVSGEDNILSRVSRVVCPVDLANSTGVDSLRLRPQARDAKGNAINEGLRIVPETVIVHTAVSQKMTSRELMVKAQFKGIVAEGYRVKEVAIEPVKASIISKQELPAEQGELVTAEIDLAGKKQSFSQEVALQIPSGAKVYPAQVLVEVSIEKIPAEEGDQNEDSRTRRQTTPGT
ncbi:CdaR family protein [Syntrophomonas curvata]